MDPFTFRAAERILAVAIGGFSVFLGYRLFLKIPDRSNSEGRVALPGGVSIFITRVGPGAFFALFGATIVALSLYQAIKYSETALTKSTAHVVAGDPGRADQTTVLQAKDYSGFGSTVGPFPDQTLELERMQISGDLGFVETILPTLLRPDLSRERRNDVDALSKRVKIALMKAAWGPGWGDFDEFRQWAEKGAPDPVPKAIAEAAAYYRRGLGVAK